MADEVKIISIPILLDHQDFLTQVGVWDLIATVLNAELEEQHVTTWDELDYDIIDWDQYSEDLNIDIVAVVNGAITRADANEILNSPANADDLQDALDNGGVVNTYVDINVPDNDSVDVTEPTELNIGGDINGNNVESLLNVGNDTVING